MRSKHLRHWLICSMAETECASLWDFALEFACICYISCLQLDFNTFVCALHIFTLHKLWSSYSTQQVMQLYRPALPHASLLLTTAQTSIQHTSSCMLSQLHVYTDFNDAAGTAGGGRVGRSVGCGSPRHCRSEVVCQSLHAFPLRCTPCCSNSRHARRRGVH